MKKYGVVKLSKCGHYWGDSNTCENGVTGEFGGIIRCCKCQNLPEENYWDSDIK